LAELVPLLVGDLQVVEALVEGEAGGEGGGFGWDGEAAPLALVDWMGVGALCGSEELVAAGDVLASIIG
jgi:hypothetical protein